MDSHQINTLAETAPLQAKDSNSEVVSTQETQPIIPSPDSSSTALSQSTQVAATTIDDTTTVNAVVDMTDDVKPTHKLHTGDTLTTIADLEEEEFIKEVEEHHHAHKPD